MNKLLLLLLPITVAGCCWRTKQKPVKTVTVEVVPSRPMEPAPIQHVHHIMGLKELVAAIIASNTGQEIEAPIVAEKDKIVKQVEEKAIHFAEHEAMHLVEDYVKSKI